MLDICKSRAGADILIPWIQSFFEPLLNLDGHTHPLRHFTLVMTTHSSELDTTQWESEWDQYAVLNQLFAQPVFAPLELVTIVVKGSNRLLIPTEILGWKLPFLKGSPKLKVELQPWRD